MSLPREGVLVLDLTRVLEGPYCTMLLGDMGARVIKVEHPSGGDVTRGWGPPYEPQTGMSAYYLAVNRNRESIVSEWLERFRAAGVPGPVRGALEALRSEVARALGAVVRRQDVPFVASPIHFAGVSPRLDFPPQLDQHGDASRHEFGSPAREG